MRIRCAGAGYGIVGCLLVGLGGACATGDDGTADVQTDGERLEDASAPLQDAQAYVRDAAADSAVTTADSGRDGAVWQPNVAACNLTTLCESARDMTSIPGDTGSPVSSTMGMTTETLRIRVTDTTNTGDKIKARVVLSSPPGANYDLFVRKPATSQTPMKQDCSAVPLTSEQEVGDDTVALVWDDVLNGIGSYDGDGRVLSIEVRFVSGECDPTKPWTLSVYGNAN